MEFGLQGSATWDQGSMDDMLGGQQKQQWAQERRTLTMASWQAMHADSGFMMHFKFGVPDDDPVPMKMISDGTLSCGPPSRSISAMSVLMSRRPPSEAR